MQVANVDSDNSPPCCIRDIIQNKRLQPHFQPIVSIRRRDVIGLEALARGIGEGGSLISPDTLFGLAAVLDTILDLDKLCSKTAAENFLRLHAANPKLILFLNFHPSTVVSDLKGCGELLDVVEHLNLNPHNIVIEILESHIDDIKALSRMVDSYKQHGFLVALDDIGCGHSNLDRIAFIKPDILKIDRSLVQNIHNEYHKQQIFKSLVMLSEKIGGWVIAEGIECQEEAIAVLELGADLLQGYYFARPHAIDAERDNGFQDTINDTANKFKSHKLAKIKARKSKQEERLAIVDACLRELTTTKVEDFDWQLNEIINHYPSVESIHVLDETGIQVSDCICNLRHLQPQKTIIFPAPVKGTDHSLKEYYYLLLEAQFAYYTTELYVPRPSGDLCVTVSARFHDANNQLFILCVAMYADFALEI
jgi:EAL domain-containing protein (putative c-di-GMP-specific phosphodiesterase class I)